MRSRALRVFVAVAVAFVAMGLAWSWLWEETLPAPSAGVHRDTATVPGSSSGPASSAGKTGEPPAPERSPLLPQPSADFDSLLEKLVDLGTRLTPAVDEGNRELAERLSGESSSVLEALQQSIREPEDRALHRLTGLDPAAGDISSRVRRRVLVLLVTRGLERRLREGRATGSQRRLDALVSATLATLPLGEKLAQELGANLLVGSPYVGLPHEEAVLDLVAMSTERLFLRGISTELLLTLWNNLHESGARSSSELTSLALLFKDEPTPANAWPP